MRFHAFTSLGHRRRVRNMRLLRSQIVMSTQAPLRGQMSQCAMSCCWKDGYTRKRRLRCPHEGSVDEIGSIHSHITMASGYVVRASRRHCLLRRLLATVPSPISGSEHAKRPPCNRWMTSCVQITACLRAHRLLMLHAAVMHSQILRSASDASLTATAELTAHVLSTASTQEP